MKYKMLGSTGVKLSEVGYGAAALFGKDVLGKQGITERQAYQIFMAAVRRGVTFFDTGINYGYAEERLGRCISRAARKAPSIRSKLVIETKCGETINPDGSYGASDWSPGWVRRSLEISLERLGLEYVDLFAMHGGSVEDCSDRLIHTFQDLKAQGLIRAYGINTFDTKVLKWAAKERCFDYVMLDYNILRQDREPLIDVLAGAGVAVIAGSAMGESLYVKGISSIRGRNDLWYLARAAARFRGLAGRSRGFKFLARQEGYTANQLALRYVLDNKNVSSAVFSTVNLGHLVEDLEAVDMQMPEGVRREIKKRAGGRRA